MPVFLAVLNMRAGAAGGDRAQHGARADGAAARRAVLLRRDREQPLASIVERLDTVLFHKKLGTYLEKSERVARAGGADRGRRVQAPQAAAFAREAGRLCKADLATDMVRELTELQGTMGGIYAREDGRPEEVWKAIYFHYLPVGVEADRAADEGTARQGGDHLGGGVARRQARHRDQHVRRRRAARPDRAIRTACAAPRRASSASWSICRS